jgi:anti-sigma regulatory factor (Ser/Thr protein kinase)
MKRTHSSFSPEREIEMTAMNTEARATFPSERRSAGHARRWVNRQLSEWACRESADVVVLLVSELVTNAVLHAAGPVEVALSLEGSSLRVEVSDRDPRLPPPRADRSEHAPTGRGLLLVDRTVDRWGVERLPGGKKVWFELAADGRRRAEGDLALSASS